MKILVAEDNRELSSTIKRGLELFNFEVDTVYDGVQALENLSSISYDLLLLDIMMPRMDGIQVCKTLRNRGNNIPIIILTAKSEIDDEILGIASGADEYIAKPFSLRKLAVLIEKMTGQANKDQVDEFLDLSFMNNIFVVKSAQPVKTTFREYTILHHLAKNNGKFVIYDNLKYIVKLQDDDHVNLKILIDAIEAKLSKTGSKATIVHEEGKGYMLCIKS